MTEQHEGFARPAADPPAPDPRSTATGVPAVDAVLEDLDGLDELPLEEHVGAFERAHDSLRSALDAPPDDPA